MVLKPDGGRTAYCDESLTINYHIYTKYTMNKSKRVSQKQKQIAKSNDFKGHRVRVLSHPPEFMYRPWYALQVRIDDLAALGDGLLTTAELAATIESQLGISVSGDILNVRIQEVKAWGNLTGALAPVTMIVYDLVAGTQNLGSTNTIADRTLEVIREYPDAVNRAAVGYKYSKVQQNVSLWLSASPTNAKALYSFQGCSLVYVYLLWRCGNPSI